jgi:hypothetical protein
MAPTTLADTAQALRRVQTQVPRNQSSLQVCPREVRLIADDAAQQVLPLAQLLPNPDDDDEELVIVGAEVAGSYVLLLLSDGAGVLLRHSPDAGSSPNAF